MNEKQLVDQTPSPITIESLKQDLINLGLSTGMTVLVHSSLSSLGWVCGGAQAVILALEEVVTETGCIMMPSHSGDLTEPSYWRNPPVPEDWWPVIRQSMPAFQTDISPTRGMGCIAEAFRKQDGVLRSPHPHLSFSAWGRHAQMLTAKHPLDCALGDESPLGRLYDLGGYVLLLGVGHDSNTSLHLAEYRADLPNKTYSLQGAPLLVDHRRQWVQFQDLDTDVDDFPAAGRDFEVYDDTFHESFVGMARVKFFSQPKLVDFAVKWFECHRKTG